MTKAMRLSQRVEQMSRYERVAIRLQFPDQQVLQALFRPRETVHALYKFVAQRLARANADFYLCESKHIQFAMCTLASPKGSRL